MSDSAEMTHGMTVEDFVAWAEDRPGRYELHDGSVVTMQSERVAHVLVKTGVLLALREALRHANSPCRAFGDGVTVKVEANTAFEPDCTIHCGPVDPESLLVTHPVVVVEVLSPSSHASDFTKKLPGYFRVASIAHYLIIDAEKRMVIHHSRLDDAVATRFVHATQGEAGRLSLEPPGILVSVADFFTELDAA